MADRMVTMSDIAARAGVSTVSVSKALSGQKGVSAEVREQIQALAEEMGYRHVHRKREGGQLSVTVGILVAERFMREGKSFYWSVIQELTRVVLERKSFCVLEAVTAEDEERVQLPGLFTGEKADGFIVLGAFRPEYEKSLIREAKRPVLFVDTRPADPSCDAVVSDNYAGGRIMTDYLFSLGFRRIAFVGTLLSTSSIDERFFGYCRSLIGHGERVADEWVIPDRDLKDGIIDPERFIRLPERMPEAFFCNCDRVAEMLIEKLQRAGYRVPDDISVAGYDNFLPGGNVEEAGITTYALDIREIARKTFHMIRHKIASPYSYGLVSVSGTFLERGSARKRGDGGGDEA